jgi:hypothetical protein
VDEDTDRRFRLLAAGGAVAVVAAIFMLRSNVDALTAAAPAAAAPTPGISLPGGEVRGAASSAVPAPGDIETIATVYECSVDGHRMFSDQRCGRGARARDIHAPNRMDPTDTSILDEPVSAAAQFAQPPAYQVRVPHDDTAECAAIEQEKASINAHMREGYSAAEGERLRERLRRLDDRYYELRCRHFH